MLEKISLKGFQQVDVKMNINRQGPVEEVRAYSTACELRLKARYGMKQDPEICIELASTLIILLLKPPKDD